MTRIRKLVIIGLCIKGALTCWVVSSYFTRAHETRERVLQAQIRIQTEAARNAVLVSEDLWHRAERAHTLEEWEALSQANVFEMAEQDQEQFRTMVQSKLFEMLFWRAEQLMAHARGLLEQNQNNPTAADYLERARKIYERIEGLMSDIGEVARNDLWNMRLYYLKGAYYSRSLALIRRVPQEQAKVKDAVAQAVTSLDKALSHAPKDRDTQVAIELLQKKAKDAMSLKSGAGKEKMELRLLPAKDKEVGPFQTGPREEGKH